MTLPEHSRPTTASPGYPNTTKTQENYLRSNLIQMTEAFKEETNTSLKEIQEKFNQIEVFKEERSKSLKEYRKMQLNG